MRYRDRILAALQRYAHGMTAANLYRSLNFACSERTVRNTLVNLSKEGALIHKVNYCEHCGCRHKIYKVRGE